LAGTFNVKTPAGLVAAAFLGSDLRLTDTPSRSAESDLTLPVTVISLDWENACWQKNRENKRKNSHRAFERRDDFLFITSNFLVKQMIQKSPKQLNSKGYKFFKKGYIFASSFPTNPDAYLEIAG